MKPTNKANQEAAIKAADGCSVCFCSITCIYKTKLSAGGGVIFDIHQKKPEVFVKDGCVCG